MPLSVEIYHFEGSGKEKKPRNEAVYFPASLNLLDEESWDITSNVHIDMTPTSNHLIIIWILARIEKKLCWRTWSVVAFKGSCLWKLYYVVPMRKYKLPCILTQMVLQWGRVCVRGTEVLMYIIWYTLYYMEGSNQGR